MPQNDFSYVDSYLMPKISRTFDYTIKELPEDLRKSSVVAYAFFRAIDCVEDSPLSHESKISLMNEIVATFSDGISSAEALDERLFLINPKKKQYLELLRNYSRVVNASKILDRETIALISKYGRQMADGLSNPEIQRITTLENHHRYCHYAAAVVGYFITNDMWAKGYISDELLQKLMPSTDDNNPSVGKNPAHDLAVALQLTNNIRDLHDDYIDGIYRWPSSLLSARGLTYEDVVNPEIPLDKLRLATGVLREQIDDAKRYFPSATSWIDDIPFQVHGKNGDDIKGIKKSWGSALAFSAATLRKINTEQFFKDKSCRKINRKEIRKISKAVRGEIDSRRGVRSLIYNLFEDDI